jgi:hypothetical protein
LCLVDELQAPGNQLQTSWSATAFDTHAQGVDSEIIGLTQDSFHEDLVEVAVDDARVEQGLSNEDTNGVKILNDSVRRQSFREEIKGDGCPFETHRLLSSSSATWEMGRGKRPCG